MEVRPSLWSREIDLSFLWRIPRENPLEAMIWVGVCLRLLVYSWNRDYWLDEATLLGNIEGKAAFEFSGYLEGDQLAPFGFLAAQRVLVSLLGSSGYVTRAIPLACGIGSLWLFRSLALRWLSFPAAFVAMTLFAMSDDLVYYSSELKPYSCDVALGLLILLAGERLRSRAITPGEAVGQGLMLAAVPWFSFPTAFVVAGVGAAIFFERMAQRAWKDAAWLVGIGGAWLASFFLSYRASHALLQPATTMYVFWDFAFLPFPPRDVAAVRKLGGVILEVFVNPLHLLSWHLPAWWVGFPAAVLAVGVYSLARRDRTTLLMVVIPILLAMGAAAARRYPFHGRLILGLVPGCFLLLAEGLDFVRLQAGRKPFLALAVLLLAFPCLSTLYESQGKRLRDFNAHGDLHNNRFVE